jgi:hypothetical protein
MLRAEVEKCWKRLFSNVQNLDFKKNPFFEMIALPQNVKSL